MRVRQAAQRRAVRPRRVGRAPPPRTPPGLVRKAKRRAEMAETIASVARDDKTPPLGPKPLFVTANIAVPGIDRLQVYREHGGYRALETALRDCQPEQLVEAVKKSGLRGRGGAGFPTGMKWSFLAKNTGKPSYLIVNCDESEPGTFKDRMLMELLPHEIVEGTIIAAYANGVHH